MALATVTPLSSQGQHFKMSACIIGGPGVGKHFLKAKLECGDMYGRPSDLTAREKEGRAKFTVDSTDYSVSLSVSNGLPADDVVLEEMQDLYGYIVTYRAVILAYSVSSQVSFEYAVSLYSRIKELRKDRDLPLPILLVGCQSDKRYREVQTATARGWAAEHDDVVFEETSALTGHNVKEAFQKLAKQLHMYLDWGLLPIPKFSRHASLPSGISVGTLEK